MRDPFRRKQKHDHRRRPPVPSVAPIDPVLLRVVDAALDGGDTVEAVRMRLWAASSDSTAVGRAMKVFKTWRLLRGRG